MTTARDTTESSTGAARRRVEARLRAKGVVVPAMPFEASEGERRRAAVAALEALQPGRARAFADWMAAAGTSVASAGPVPLDDAWPGGVANDPAGVAPKEVAAPVQAPVPPRVRPRARRVGAGERILSAARSVLWPCAVAAVAGMAGFVLARASVPSVIDPASASAVAPAVPTGPSADGLVADNLRLQRALVTAETELATLRGALARSDAPADGPVDGPTRASIDAASLDVGALADAGLDEAESRRVATALAEADAELVLIDLGSADPSADRGALARARLAARGRLLDAIGVDAFVAARAARGEPNRVSLTAVPAGPAFASLRPGDALLAIDGRPAFDADDVVAADGSEPRGLVVLRRGERTSITVDAPLSMLDVATDSLPAWAWVGPDVESP